MGRGCNKHEICKATCGGHLFKHLSYRKWDLGEYVVPLHYCTNLACTFVKSFDANITNIGIFVLNAKSLINRSFLKYFIF